MIVDFDGTARHQRASEGFCNQGLHIMKTTKNNCSDTDDEVSITLSSEGTTASKDHAVLPRCIGWSSSSFMGPHPSPLSGSTTLQRQEKLQRSNGALHIVAPRRFSTGGSLTSFFGGGKRSWQHQQDLVPFWDLINRSNDLLEDVRKALIERTKDRGTIQQSLEVHTDRATARFMAGNTSGALMSIKKIKTLEAQKTNLAAALCHLQAAEDDLIDIADRSTGLFVAQFKQGIESGTAGSRSPDFFTQHLSLSVDLAQFECILDDVDKIITTETEPYPSSLSEEELLSVLKNMVCS